MSPFPRSYGKLYQLPAGTLPASPTPAQLQAALAALVQQIDQPNIIPFYGVRMPNQVNGRWIYVIRKNDPAGQTLVIGDIPREVNKP